MLEEHASFIYACGKKYYFLPFYFKDGGTDKFEMFHLDHLPEELKKAIKLVREHPEKFITINHKKNEKP